MSIWDHLDHIVGRHRDVDALRSHGLHLWAARRWHDTGRPVPDMLIEHQRAAMVVDLAVAPTLGWVRTVLDGPILVLKGPEVAARYPGPALRPYADLDLLVPDAIEAQRRLVAAGCEELTSDQSEHLSTLRCPQSPLLMEIHDHPRWPRWTTATTAELFEVAVPTKLGVDGVMTVSPAHHAVLLAAHSWQHEPFRRIVDLVDVAVMLAACNQADVDALARQWRLDGIWRSTSDAIASFETGRRPQALMDRLLTRHLWDVRQRTTTELRMARWVAGYRAPNAAIAARTIARTVADDLIPSSDESWRDKLARIPRTVRNSFTPSTERVW